MSDHPREAQRNLKNLNICNDIWLDAIRWVDRAKVGLELALLSDHFDTLVDEHFKTRKWTLGRLEIHRDQDNSAKIVKYPFKAEDEPMPLPEEPLPRNIVGFEHLAIYYVNDNVIAFLRRIRRLFESDMKLDFLLDLGLSRHSNHRWAVFATKIWPLLNVCGINKLCLDHYDLTLLRAHISPTILRDCSNLRSIFTSTLIAFPPADADIDGTSVGQALSKWLHTPRADGRPKMLELSYPAKFDWIDQLKETFLNATTSVSFIIVLHFNDTIEPFEVDNLYTRERLALRRTVNKSWPWLVERGPIATDAQQQRAEWEREVLETIDHFGFTDKISIILHDEASCLIKCI